MSQIHPRQAGNRAGGTTFLQQFHQTHRVHLVRGVALSVLTAAALVVVAPDRAYAQRAATNRNAIPHAETRSEITFEDLAPDRAHAQRAATNRNAIPRAETHSENYIEDLASIGSIGAPALSPDGRELALVQEGQIVLVSADGGWPSPLTTTVGGKSGVAWSPDGRSVVFVSDSSI
jgi:dipeptidyl aminopeptidase/acylaminoacyl peptidase